MTEQNAIRLKEQLKKLGFEEAVRWIDDYRTSNERKFSIFSMRELGNDQLFYALRFEKKDNNLFVLQEYDLTIRTIPIPVLTIQGINTAELESLMKQADELYNLHYDAPEKAAMRSSDLVQSIREDIDILAKSPGVGNHAAQLLLYKYWPEAEYGSYFVLNNDLDKKYSIELKVDVAHAKPLTADESYAKLKSMNRDHVLSDDLLRTAHMKTNKGYHYIAYNSLHYFLGKQDMQFFKTQTQADKFSANNNKDQASFKVVHAASVDELMKQIPYGEQLRVQLITNKNLSIMNEKNFDYLKDNLKYMGFGEKQHEALEANLKEGKEAFQLTFNADVNKKPFEAVLQFRKSDSSDMYFLNSYQATLERSNGEKKEQTFYLNKGKGVTAKEAYNLLEGRPVFKELINKANEPYKAWIQLDFENKDKHQNHEVKQFHENYGYDLKAAVSKFAVKELDGGENEKKLLHSLEKGNIQSVSIEKDGTAVKMFIEANPQYKTVTVYDEHLKRVQKEDLLQYQSVQHLNVKEMKQAAGQEKKEVKEDLKQGKQVGKKNKNEADDSLLPKKRNRTKKGLGLK